MAQKTHFLTLVSFLFGHKAGIGTAVKIPRFSHPIHSLFLSLPFFLVLATATWRLPHNCTLACASYLQLVLSTANLVRHSLYRAPCTVYLDFVSYRRTCAPVYLRLPRILYFRYAVLPPFLPWAATRCLLYKRSLSFTFLSLPPTFLLFHQHTCLVSIHTRLTHLVPGHVPLLYLAKADLSPSGGNRATNIHVWINPGGYNFGSRCNLWSGFRLHKYAYSLVPCGPWWLAGLFFFLPYSCFKFGGAPLMPISQKHLGSVSRLFFPPPPPTGTGTGRQNTFNLAHRALIWPQTYN